MCWSASTNPDGKDRHPNNMIHFCTHFDQNYLSRGLLLLESLRARCEKFHLHVVCLDDFTQTFLTRLGYAEITCTPLAEVERWAPELLTCQQKRSPSEYCYTLSPFVPLYLLRQYPHLDFVCSLDADLYFYQDPVTLFADFERHSILITTHDFADHLLEERLKTGVYNVCLQAFRNDATGLACLEKWRQQCTEWCYAHYDAAHDRFADQKYLETWPTDFEGKVQVLSGPSVNLATWNVNRYQLRQEHRELRADGQPVVFYHFHGLRLLSNRWVGNTFHWYRTRPHKVLVKNVYLPYLSRLLEWEKTLAQAGRPAQPIASRRSFPMKVVRAGAVFFFYRPSGMIYLNFDWFYQFYSNLKQTLWPAKSTYKPLPTTEAT